MPNRPCRECRKLTRNATGICDDCRIPHERERKQRRSEKEPWRRLYFTRAWRDARRAALRRDHYQCRAKLADGSRCPELDAPGRPLQLHHRVPLYELWAKADGASNFHRFIHYGTDLRVLVSLCPDHHAQADEALRANNQEN